MVSRDRHEKQVFFEKICPSENDWEVQIYLPGSYSPYFFKTPPTKLEGCLEYLLLQGKVYLDTA
jgi:hypothetical protein